jgi:CTP synthase (UTP-ammonia lyase)
MKLQALKHASIAEKRSLEICWVDSSDLEPATKVCSLAQAST